MSDYLFRMVGRAAGSEAQVPHPPQDVRWPLEPETQGAFPPASPFRLPRTAPTQRRATSHFEGTNQYAVPKSPIPLSPAPPHQPLAVPSAEARPTNDVTDGVIAASGTVEWPPQSASPTGAIAHFPSTAHPGESHASDSPQSRAALISNSRMIAPKVTSELGIRHEPMPDTAVLITNRNSNRGTSQDPVPVRPPAETSKPLAKPDVLAAPEFLPRQLLPSTQGPVPAASMTTTVVRPGEPVRTPRDAPARESSSRGSRETPEPAVEVKIGRVEVRFDTPATGPAPTRPARPSGFAEFAALRRYATQPWPAGNR